MTQHSRQPICIMQQEIGTLVLRKPSGKSNCDRIGIKYVAGLSKMHFAAQFRAATGYRPHEYLLHQRVERAKAMLSSLEMPLVEVALSVGFRAQAHFSTVFKRLTGETPGRWRRSVVWGRAD